MTKKATVVTIALIKFGEGEGLRFKTIKYCFEMEESNPHGFEARPE